MAKSKSAINHKKLEMMKRLEALMDNLRHDRLEIEDVSHIQTADFKNGMIIITSIKDPHDR